jgi:hypothetical protein
MSQITTLIPAYKKEFLDDVILGLRRQSFQDFKVIISDDSPGGVITDMIRQGHFGALNSGLNISVVRGPQNARRNHEQLLDLWAGQSPLVHMHLDDDVIYPDFYRAHVEAQLAAPCCATVSQRWLSHDDGAPAWSTPLPDFVHASSGRVIQPSTEELFASTAGVCQNWLGELSNIVMSAEGAALFPRAPQDDLSYYGLMDIGFLLHAATHAPVTFIRDHLGVFRQHAGQTTQNVQSHGGRVGFLVWVTYALRAWRDGHLTAQQTAHALGEATRRIEQHFHGDPIVAEYFHILENQASSLDALYTAYRGFWLRLLASHPGTAPTPVATQRG